MSQALLLPIETLSFSRTKRRGISPKRVEELRRQIEVGRTMMPIRVCALGDGTYVVRDGRHRVQAHIEAGFQNILAIVENLANRIGRFLRYLFSL